MKVLIDPVYTGKVHKCSTSYMVWDVIEYLISQRKDIFFYLLYPENANEEELAFLDRHHDRVMIIPHPYLQADRVEEAFKLTNDMINILSPGDTPIWDYDVVLTSRIPQLPFMRNVSGRETNFHKGTQRLFIGLECMPFFSFRETVSWGANGNMDMVSLAAYQTAGAVVIADLWSKREITQIARRWLAPTATLTITGAIQESLPVRLERVQFGTMKHPGENLDGTKEPLCVVFAGRMTGTRNFKEVAELFRNHFSYPLAKERPIRFVVSTNSASTGSVNTGELDCMEIQYNNREQFHALLKNEAHVVVNLSTVEDFSLSTYEPLLFGVPVIVPDRPWTSFLGDDYPFRAKDFVHAYAMIKDFANAYLENYGKFAIWEQKTWRKLVEGPRNVSTGEVVDRLIDTHEMQLTAQLQASEAGATYKELVAKLSDLPGDLVEPLKFANEEGYFLTNAKQWRGIPVGKRPCQHLLKVYANLAGYQDTLDPGVMRKPINV